MPKVTSGKQASRVKFKIPGGDSQASKLKAKPKPKAREPPKPKTRPRARAEPEPEPAQEPELPELEGWEGAEFIYEVEPLDVEIHSIKSYVGSEGVKDLEQLAIEDLEFLAYYTGIVRHPPNPIPDDPTQEDQSSESEQPAPKEKGKKGKPSEGKQPAPKRKAKGKANAKASTQQETGGGWVPGMAPEDYHERARYWHFFQKPIKGTIAESLKPQLQYIEKLKRGWRPPKGKKMGMPEEWFAEETTVVLSNYNNWTQDKYDRDKVNLARIALYLGPINQHLERIATKNLIRRHLSTRLSQFMLPDFCLKFRPTRPYKDEKNSLIETIPTLERFLDIVNFPMGEENVELTTMMSFINIPVCWMVNTPTQRWLPPLAPDDYSQPVEFALVYNNVRPCDEEQVKFARKTEISYSSPAVLVGMKGPAQWPDFCRKYDQNFLYNTPEFQALDDKTKLEYCLEDLACAVQPSLDALVMTWFLRCEQQVIPKQNPESGLPMYPVPEEYVFEDDDGNIIPGEEETEDIDEFLPDPDDHERIPDRLEWLELPEWAWIPGILYDYNTCYLVAHIPIVPHLGSEWAVEYVSYVFDEIPIDRPATADENDTAILLERVRLGLAWLVMGKQAFKVTSLWDSVIQPLSVMRYEELAALRESKHGITERPPSPKRHVVRRVRLEGDTNAWTRRHLEGEAEASIRDYQNLDMDDFLEVESRDEVAWDKRYEKDKAHLQQRIAPRIDKWLKGIERPEEMYFEGVVFNEGEMLPIRGL